MSEAQAPAAPAQPSPSPAAPAPAIPASAPTPTDWTHGFNDETRAYVQNKGFRGPQDVLESYRNFEKTMGAKAEHLLKLPENMDSPEGRAIWEKLGAPKEPKDYKIDVPKEFGDEKLAEGLREIAHKNGFTHKQIEGLVGWWNERTGSAVKSQKEANEVRLTEAQQNLKKEWGSAFEQNKNIANQGALKVGMGEKEVQALGAALGPDKALMLLHKLGTATGEATFVGGGPAGGGGLLTPSAAKAEINALKSDPSFQKRFASGDLDAKRQWDKLHLQLVGAAR